MLGPESVLFAYSAGGPLGSFTFSRASNGTYRDRTGTLQTAASTVSRLHWTDVDGDGGWEQPGLLLEGGSTNDWQHSEAFDQPGWSKFNTTVSADEIAAADGATSADLILETTSTGTAHGITNGSGTMTAESLQSISVFAKARERQWLRIRTDDGAGVINQTWFDVLNGEIGTTSTGHVLDFIEAYRAGWYRVGVVFVAATSASPSASQQFHLATSDGATAYAGATSAGLYLWGAQFEADQEFPTSYIATSGLAVSRGADSLTHPINFGIQDISVYMKFPRPDWYDLNTPPNLTFNPQLFEISTDKPLLRVHHDAGSFARAAFINTSSGGSQQSVVITTAGNQEILAQFRNLSTAGEMRIESDSATGFPAWGGPHGAGIVEFGGTNIQIGRQFGGSVISMKVIRGLVPLTEARNIPTPMGR